ncbi:MAG: nitroreductase family protein, partial [Defluviitaleaceae bacterium]|nr:nitroreductase family protein [Defluviitaleaceae bacterium]
MNEILKAIQQRYSCRGYTDQPLTQEQLKTIAKAALHSPSAMNRQPWHLIVISDKTIIDKLCAQGMAYMKALPDQSMYQRFMDRGGKLLYNAPALYLI